MKEIVKNFKRQELFDHYNANTNPFSFVTVKFDITNLYKLGRINHNQYATIGYYIIKVVNEIDAFKYRFCNGEIIKYDSLNTNFTNIIEDGIIGFYRVPMCDDYLEFIDKYNSIYQEFMESKINLTSDEQDEIWLSCEPWFSATSIVPPFNKDVTIPQFIWDKFVFDGERVYTNLMIMTHHGFVDGKEIGEFVNKFQELINSIKVNVE